MTTATAAAYKDGLEDVIAARSAICRVDGEAGRLYYRGYEIADLVSTATFEEATYLLWFGELPSPAERATFAASLAATRPLPPAVLDLLRRLPRDCHPLDALRTAVSLAAAFDPDVRSNEPEANLRKAYRLMTVVPATVAAWQRIRTGREPVAAPLHGSHAASFLTMLDGREPSAEVARVLDVILTLHADHEFNASTFAARVAVATVADMHSAVLAAI
ncbi:MAG TPA: citrate/2-methylcitrate synthase, partial [Candidatus Bathyarchaeia archaeon]|nr:citrate/2-methylcitrate synthase [Candidatus Bathyarchaeia archaeon]